MDILPEMPEIVRQYALYYRNIKGRAPKTVNEYCSDLRTFFRFMKHFRGYVSQDTPMEEIPIDDIDLEFIRSITTMDIFEFMNYAADGRSNMSSTRQRKSSSLSGEYVMGQYDTDGCPLDMSECTTDKRELINGIAEVPMNAEDPNKTGNILLEPGQTRELVFIYLLSDESVYVRTDDEAAERDGVKNYIEIVENYFIDAYTETDCRYTIDVNSGLGPFVHYDVSDIVNDFFTEHK